MTGPVRPPLPPLAGREREQAALREALAAARAGRGSLVLIGGEAGVGKTALAEAALAEAATQGAQVLVGRCYDLSETPPYGPWAEALERAPRGDAVPAPPELAAGGGAASQAALFAVVRDYLATLAAQRPLVLLLDDLHWADPASLDLLRALGRHRADLPVLLVATYRADELTRRHPLYQLLPLLDREARAVRLDLRRFDAAAVGALAAARYALPEADAARLVAWLLGRAEGNAFFTVQLLRSLEDAGTLAPAGDGWALGDLGELALPLALRQVLDARLARLGADHHRLLTLAAIVGQEVPIALWAAVAETGEEGLLDAVDAAVEANLVAVSGDGGTVRFAHALIREAFYEGLVATRRRRVHRAAAEALLATATPDPDAVANHLQRAGDPRAAEWLVRAGERAQRAYAWLTAAARFEAALALPGEGGMSDADRAYLLLRLATMRRYASPTDAITLVDEAARLAARAEDAPLAAVATFRRGLLLCFAGELRRGIADLAAGVEAVEALPPAGVARLLDSRDAPSLGGSGVRGTLALFLAETGRYAQALAQAERAVADAPDPATLVGYGSSGHGDAYLALLCARALLGEPGAAHPAYQHARALYRAVAHHTQVGNAAHYALVCLALPYHADDPARCRQLAAEADAAFLRAGEALLGYRPGLAYAPLRFVTGDWGAVPASSEGGTVVAPLLATGLGALARLRGDTATAWHQARAAVPGGPDEEPGDRIYLPALEGQRLAAALCLDAGDLATARAWLVAHDRWLAWSGAVLWRAEGALGWAAYHRADGEPDEARRHAERALALATEPRQPLALLAARRTLGELATETGRHGEAERHLSEALALADVCAAPYERALTLLALADLRAVTGDRAVADTVEEARAILEPLGASPALARAAALVAPPPATTRPAGPVSNLTARELEVLQLVARGHSNAEVGERLFLSPRTVGQHLRSIYNKLGVDNRTAATRLAAERGLA